MNAPTRLAAFGAALVVVFGAAFFAAKLVAPERSEPATADSTAPAMSAPGARGTALSENGFALGVVNAPTGVSTAGELSFQILGADGQALTGYTESHEKLLHLIVVRSDGAEFRHVHPALDDAGTWSLPWTWDAAGSYRVFADFVPEGGEPTTLTRTVDVAGDFTPQPQNPTTTARVGGFDVALAGSIDAGRLTFEVTRDGQAVTTLEPYLGAFGHLVALRQGDLAYLHVHPESSDSGPTISFSATAPTAGRYLLYLDFKVDGEVHTAAFVVDSTAEAAPEVTVQPAPAEHGGEHGGH